MWCPKCEGKTWVMNCVIRKDNTIRRIRECQQCGYRFTTFESREDVKNDLRKLEKIREIVNE